MVGRSQYDTGAGHSTLSSKNFIRQNVESIKCQSNFDMNKDLHKRGKNYYKGMKVTATKNRYNNTGFQGHVTNIYDKRVEELDKISSNYRKYNYYGQKNKF